MGEQNIIDKIKEILLEDPEVKEKWDDLTHIDSIADALKSFKLIYFFIKKLIYTIEIIQAEFGGMTKDERIEYAAEVLDDLIEFSGWAIWVEAIDYTIFKFMISQVVAALDDKFGSGNWFVVMEAQNEVDKDALLYNACKTKFESVS